MKNLAILLILIFFVKPSHAQKWNSSFFGKPESRALYASNIAKAIQNAWENELSSKGKKEMLLDEIIFGQDSEPKELQSTEIDKPMMNNIDEIEEVLGIKEEIRIDPFKKKKSGVPVSDILLKIATPVETEEVTPMGNVDEVKEASKKQIYYQQKPKILLTKQRL